MAQETISTKDLVALLESAGIEMGDRRLRQLAEEGFFPPPARGHWQRENVLLGLAAYYEQLTKKKSDNRKAIDDRMALARCKLAEKEAAVAGDEVEDVTEVEKSRIALVNHVRGRLLGLSDKLVQRLSACQSTEQIQKILDDEITDILTALAEPVFVPRAESQDGAGQ